MKAIVFGLALGLCMLTSGFAAERQGAFVQCDDGRRIPASPFGVPAKMCGEVEVDNSVDDLGTQYAELFGALPTRANTGLTGRELRTARHLWKWGKTKFGGIVEPVDVVDLAGAVSPAAVKSAIEIGELDEDTFTPEAIDQITDWFVQYGLGVPKFYLHETGKLKNVNGELVSARGFYLYVALDGLASHKFSGATTLTAPQVIIANAQVAQMQNGVCVANVIGLIQNASTRNPCGSE